MKLLLTVVLPIVVIVLAVIHALADPNVGRIVGTSIGLTLTIAAHMFFWTTGVFVLMERTGVGKEDLSYGEWTPKDLPKYEPKAP